MEIEKRLGRQRNGGRAVQGIYLAEDLNGERRKESVAENDGHLGGLGDVSLTLQLRKGLLSMQPAAFAPVLWGCTGKEPWRSGGWRRK